MAVFSIDCGDLRRKPKDGGGGFIVFSRHGGEDDAETDDGGEEATNGEFGHDGLVGEANYEGSPNRIGEPSWGKFWNLERECGSDWKIGERNWNWIEP